MKKNILKIVVAAIFVIAFMINFGVTNNVNAYEPISGGYTKKALSQSSDGSYCCKDAGDWDNCSGSPDC